MSKNNESLRQKIDASIPKKTQKIIIYMVGILMVVIAYAFVFLPMNQKNMEDSTKIQTMSMEASRLRTMDKSKEKNQQEINQMTQDIKSILALYPEEIKEEEILVSIIDIEKKTGMENSDIVFGDKNLLSSADDAMTMSSQTTTADTSADETETATENVQPVAGSFQLFSTSVNCTFLIGYDAMKDLFNLLANDPMTKQNIEGIYLSYDSDSGKLVGNLVFNYYTVQGNEDSNVSIVIPKTQIGSNNIFHSVK